MSPKCEIEYKTHLYKDSKKILQFSRTKTTGNDSVAKKNNKKTKWAVENKIFAMVR